MFNLVNSVHVKYIFLKYNQVKITSQLLTFHFFLIFRRLILRWNTQYCSSKIGIYVLWIKRKATLLNLLKLIGVRALR